MAEPLCKYFGKCSGCSLQHLEYPVQLDMKRKNLAHAVNFNEIRLFSSNAYGYRNRLDMIFYEDGIGLRMKSKAGRIIGIEGCAIANEKINLLIREARAFFKGVDYFDFKSRRGTFRYAVIRTSRKESSISFVLNEESTKLRESIEKVKDFASVTTADSVLVAYVPAKSDCSLSNNFFVVKGIDLLKELILGREFFYSVQGFFQNNTEMAEKMNGYCHKLLQEYNTKDASLLDLYGGVGVFGITNAGLFHDITTVESDNLSISAANINLQRNSIEKARVINLDAEHLKRVDFSRPLFVIADPPRTGMHPKAIEHLKNLKPEVILYVSCNIRQLGKDVLKFKGYKIKSAAMFDLFPQTEHTEAVVELVKENGQKN